ncbi:hypothetical protein [Aurantiacibacter xanthus]|nr:hypothetical protein [Aurantiacibacter xanthus]
MTASFARIRQLAASPVDLLRIAVVMGCALALILAGQALPF